MASMETTRLNQVFIVDDSAPIRARLAEMLSRIDDVRLVGEAASAHDAVTGILRTRPDAVLLDLNLMGRTGLDVMRAVCPRAPGTVFVVLSNHSESQYRDACARAGASYFLDKSTEFDRVPDVLAQIASTRH
jgi:two-component system response regulator DevR